MGSELPNEDIRTYRVLLLGPESSGKTTILYRLKLNEVISSIPTIGFNVETLVHSNNKYTLWDLGGSPRMRYLWPHYYDNTNAIIFVIDANDESKFEDAKNCLNIILSVDSLQKVPLLFLINKTDLGDITVPRIADIFNLYAIKNREWLTQLCSAFSGKGLEEGLIWLDSTMEKIYKDIIEAHEIKNNSESIGRTEAENPEVIEKSEPEKQELPEYRILLLGIQNVGKTTLLYRLKCNSVMTVCQTIGFNVECISYSTCNFTIWDVGGIPRIRLLWRHYYGGTNGIIFVVDSTNDADRNEEKNELNKILAEEELAELPVLIFANKSCSAGENTEGSLKEFFGVDEIKGRKVGFIWGDCFNGIGMVELGEWLKNNVAA